MYLLDTNVLGDLVKKRPSPALLEKLQTVHPEALHTASICVMELRYGALRRTPDGHLWTQIQDRILSRVKVLPFSVVDHGVPLASHRDRRGAEFSGQIAEMSICPEATRRSRERFGRIWTLTKSAQNPSCSVISVRSSERRERARGRGPVIDYLFLFVRP